MQHHVAAWAEKTQVFHAFSTETLVSKMVDVATWVSAECAEAAVEFDRLQALTLPGFRVDVLEIIVARLLLFRLFLFGLDGHFGNELRAVDSPTALTWLEGIRVTNPLALLLAESLSPVRLFLIREAMMNRESRVEWLALVKLYAVNIHTVSPG